MANGSLLDFDTNTSHEIIVRTTDSGNLSIEQNLTINIGNVNLEEIEGAIRLARKPVLNTGV